MIVASERKSVVYDRLVRITDLYLGPVSKRFINRQIVNHLHKDPDELTCEDLQRLVDWIRVVVSLLTNDEKVVEEYISQVRILADNKANLAA